MTYKCSVAVVTVRRVSLTCDLILGGANFRTNRETVQNGAKIRPSAIRGRLAVCPLASFPFLLVCRRPSPLFGTVRVRFAPGVFLLSVSARRYVGKSRGRCRRYFAAQKAAKNFFRSNVRVSSGYVRHGVFYGAAPSPLCGG